MISSEFSPATSVAEAIARMYGLTGARPHGRGEKRALIALQDALGLDVDIVRTNAVLGAALATELGVAWDEARFTDKNRVNLDGLNALLGGATAAFQRGRFRQLRGDASPALADPQWAGFRPAISKIEAVTRIAALTGAPPETLGPGSKERKSALVNLADRLVPQANLDRSSKTRLGRSLALALDVTWPDTAYSTGETISLEGLNLLLAGAERRLGRLGSSTSDLLATAHAEAQALVSALKDGLGDAAWDGRRCVQWMMDNGVRGAFDNEWQGFYFEARGREVLGRAFTPSRRPPRTAYGHTVFDYSLNRVWDLKAHTAETVMPRTGAHRRAAGVAPLNDSSAIRQCVTDQGLGFLVLRGVGVMDEDGAFVAWHRALKAAHGVRTQPSNSGRSRLRKAAFVPLRVDAVWIPDVETLDATIASGGIRIFSQGRQAPAVAGGEGRPRNEKYLVSERGVSDLTVATAAWDSPDFDHLPSVAETQIAALW